MINTSLNIFEQVC